MASRHLTSLTGRRVPDVCLMLLIARRIPDVDTAFQKLHTYQVTQTGVPVNATLALQQYMITVAGQLADTPTRGLDDSRTGQLADATCDFACIVFVFWPFARPRVVQTATSPVPELTSPRDVQSASWQSASWRIRELSSYHAYMDTVACYVIGSSCVLVYVVCAMTLSQAAGQPRGGQRPRD